MGEFTIVVTLAGFTDRLLTENDDTAADTYDSDADCCRLRRRRALSTGGHSAS